MGAGSEFHFTLRLPLGRPEDLDAPGADDPAPRSLAGTRALLAEDNDLNAEIAAALLDMEGVAVDRAANGREAVDLFASAEPGRYDFVLMDVKMPVLDGLGAAAEIRALPRDDARAVPIVALTANTCLLYTSRHRRSFPSVGGSESPAILPRAPRAGDAARAGVE